MLHKTYKLRELYPVLATKDIETLKKERKEYLDQKKLNGPEYWEPILTAYIPDSLEDVDKDIKRPTIVIFPGGGYHMCADRVSEPVALRFVSMGYNAFVCKYECAPEKYPQQLLEAAASFAFIRKHAEEFHVDTNKMVSCGFSAGGHVAASLATFWKEDFVSKTLNVKKEDIKPNALVLSYAVITSGEFAHRGSIDNVLGDQTTPEMLEKMSLEKQVSDSVPPTFIWSTFEDDLVPVENSMLYAKALKEKDIPFELHVFEWGKHGLSLCNEITARNINEVNPKTGEWVELCDNWLKGQLI